MSLETGSILNNRYRIEGQLGKGGMGAVYLAFDQTLQIKVALKENTNVNPESERQFKREASLLASLRHPNLPRVTDHFILEGRQYLVMDYVEGEDLRAVADRQPPTVKDVLPWATAVSDALEYLHSRRPPVIHRDIKPSNIKVQPDGNVVLVDFGLAKVFDHKQTTTGARGLTPGFSPPEQYGSGRTDARSDQYALAATIYSLLTSQSPTDSIERMLGNEALVPARKLNPAIPKHIDAALTRALAVNKHERFEKVGEFREALKGMTPVQTIMQSPKTIVHPGAVIEPTAPSRTWLWALLGVAGLFGVLMVGGGLAWAFGGGLPLAGQEPTATPTELVAQETANPATNTPPPTNTPEPTEESTPPMTPTVEVVGDLRGGGGRLAFVSDRDDGRTLQLWIMDPDGSSPRQLTFGPGDKSSPEWSPDGTRLLYVAPGGTDDFGNDLGLDIWLINDDGTEIKNITHNPGDDTAPTWSPDGSRIAFTSDRINDLRQVFLMGTQCFDEQEGACWDIRPSNLSAGYAVEFDPAWSPDGGTIAVSASINGAPGRIFLRGTSPAEPTRFDRSDRIIGAEDLAWSPGSSSLAFTWVQPTSNEIYLVQLSSPTNPLKLTNSLGNRDPVFSPDGQWIVFVSTRDQNPEIYIMTANGSNQSNLSQSPTSRDLDPDWQPVLP